VADVLVSTGRIIFACGIEPAERWPGPSTTYIPMHPVIFELGLAFLFSSGYDINSWHNRKIQRSYPKRAKRRFLFLAIALVCFAVVGLLLFLMFRS
jgi:hypothetical protein